MFAFQSDGFGGVARVMATLEKKRPDFLLNEKVRPQNLSM